MSDVVYVVLLAGFLTIVGALGVRAASLGPVITAANREPWPGEQR